MVQEAWGQSRTRRHDRGHRDIRAGVTATPAAQKIPNYEEFSKQAAARNPHRRMTTVEDVARAIVVLSHPDTYWMTGNVIGVDGGEEIVG